MSPQQLIHPVASLRALATALEASITLAAADPGSKPVHKLRTTTRRVEAQLTLLVLLPGLPDHARPAEKVARLLGKLRRAAGTVRDLDVQRDLLKEHLPSAEAEALQPHAEKLRRKLKRRRADAADDLFVTLRRKGPKLTRRLEQLLLTVAEADPTLTPEDLAARISGWYTERLAADLGPALPSGDRSDFSSLDPDQLHTVRKAAKLARYLAESGASPLDPEATAPEPLASLAARFEDLQGAGGTWHDALTLADLAAKHLGPDDPLTQALRASCQRSLATYRGKLNAFQP